MRRHHDDGGRRGHGHRIITENQSRITPNRGKWASALRGVGPEASAGPPEADFLTLPPCAHAPVPQHPDRRHTTSATSAPQIVSWKLQNATALLAHVSCRRCGQESSGARPSLVCIFLTQWACSLRPSDRAQKPPTCKRSSVHVEHWITGWHGCQGAMREIAPTTALLSLPQSPPGSQWFPSVIRSLGTLENLTITYICWATSRKPQEWLSGTRQRASYRGGGLSGLEICRPCARHLTTNRTLGRTNGARTKH